VQRALHLASDGAEARRRALGTARGASTATPTALVEATTTTRTALVEATTTTRTSLVEATTATRTSLVEATTATAAFETAAASTINSPFAAREAPATSSALFEALASSAVGSSTATKAIPATTAMDAAFSSAAIEAPSATPALLIWSCKAAALASIGVPPIREAGTRWSFISVGCATAARRPVAQVWRYIRHLCAAGPRGDFGSVRPPRCGCVNCGSSHSNISVDLLSPGS
jgi:hypothetical protein